MSTEAKEMSVERWRNRLNYSINRARQARSVEARDLCFGVLCNDIIELLATLAHQQQEIEAAHGVLDEHNIPRESTLRGGIPTGDVTVKLWNRIKWLAYSLVTKDQWIERVNKENTALESQLATLREAAVRFSSCVFNTYPQGSVREAMLDLNDALANLPGYFSSAI